MIEELSKTFGEMDLNDQNILKFLHSKQKEQGKVQNGALLIQDFGLKFPFVGRERGIEQAINILQNHFQSLLKGEFDRKSHPILVASGSPGIGKVIDLRKEFILLDSSCS